MSSHRILFVALCAVQLTRRSTAFAYPPLGFNLLHFTTPPPLFHVASSLRSVAHEIGTSRPLAALRDKWRKLPVSVRRRPTPGRPRKSGFKGVVAMANCFKAYFCCDNRKEWLGRFSTAEDAARAHDARARQAGRSEDRMNFPSPKE